ncbi:MAG: helix-turn-helix domain-containing protein [Vibrio sp.]|uniref:helix-turn-helix domain-containing protein n=1 Tax=Vibrio sp. TaxID=678 RepID=UPI003A85C733
MNEPTHSFKAAQWDFFDKAKLMINGGNNRYFLQTLVRYANNENSCWRTVETLSYEMGIGEKTVRRAIKYLEDLDLIVVIRKRTREGRSHPNVYVLNMENEQLHAVTVTDTQSLDTVTMTTTNGFDAVTMTEACGQLSKNEAKKIGDTVTQSPEIRSHSPRDAVTVTDKYKVNINKNINTGVESENTLIDKQPNNFVFDISETDVLNFWTYIKGFVKRKYNRKLSATPNEADCDAIRWGMDEFAIDTNSKDDCLSLCEFVHQELGEPDKVFNPIMRLQMAAKAHPQGTMRFFEKYIDSPLLS